MALAATAIAAPVALGSAIDAVRGYAGDVNAFVLEERLAREKRAFLVDTRPLDARLRDGVPDLRGSARGKGAAVPVEAVANRGALSDARKVELELAALKVKALTRRDARVYFLGPDASALAKALTRSKSAKQGRKAFVLSGSFEAWRSSGLKVRANGSYEKSALEGLGEDTASAAGAFSRKVQAKVGTAKTVVSETSPLESVPIALGLAGLGAAAYNYEQTLRFVGVLGLELTVLAKAASYGSPKEALEDAAGALSGVAREIGGAAAKAAEARSEAPQKPKPAGSKPAFPKMPGGAGAGAKEEKKAPAAPKEEAPTKAESPTKAEAPKAEAPKAEAAAPVAPAGEERVVKKTKDGFRFDAGGAEEGAKEAGEKKSAPLAEEKLEEKKDM